MSKHTIHTTPEQSAALMVLRTRIAEYGYAILSVAPAFQRHTEDFVAMPHRSPNELVIVRPTATNTIVVRPYGHKTLYGNLKELIRLLQPRIPVPVKFGAPQLHFDRSDPDSGLQFIPENEREELRLLGYLAQKE